MKTKLILGALAALALASHAQAEKFLVAFTAIESSSDANGKITHSRDNTNFEIEDVASEQVPVPALKTLRYVFDTDTNQLQVVRRSDGVVLQVRYEFRGGVRYTQPDGKKEFRQQFVYKVGETAPIGSGAGGVTIVRDAAGALLRYVWYAKLQVGEPAGVDADGPFPAETVIGGFILGKKFVPGV